LGGAGYDTAIVGKWHLGLTEPDTPLDRGFGFFHGFLGDMMEDYRHHRRHEVNYMRRDRETIDPQGHATELFTQWAIDYVQERAKEDAPFFLYLAYNAPHWPLNSKWDEFAKYKGKYRDGWEALMRSRLARQKAMGLVDDKIDPAPHVGPKWESLTEKQRDDLDSIMAAYAGCIDSIDQNLGKLTRHLEQMGKRENTVIFFLSDNGACQEGGTLGKGSLEMVKHPPLETVDGVRLGLAWANACNTPFRLYKHYVHEGGACTPMIASWPAGIPARLEGSFVREHGYLPDFMATCVELAATEYPTNVPGCEGVSIVPLLQGSDRPIHTGPIYWEHEGNAAVRWGKWKLVREYQKPWELYDLDADRAEMHDLAKTNPEKTAEMVKLWTDWAGKNQVAFPKRFNMYEFLKNKNKE
jgi:arylsulfatase